MCGENYEWLLGCAGYVLRATHYDTKHFEEQGTDAQHVRIVTSICIRGGYLKGATTRHFIKLDPTLH